MSLGENIILLRLFESIEKPHNTYVVNVCAALEKKISDMCVVDDADISDDDGIYDSRGSAAAASNRRQRYVLRVLMASNGLIHSRRLETKLFKMLSENASEAELLAAAGRDGRNWVLKRFGKFVAPMDLPREYSDMIKLASKYDLWRNSDNAKKMNVRRGLAYVWAHAMI